ncbi:MAG TPA: hypothetical protein VF306_09270 [Pirellulales bacterium]
MSIDIARYHGWTHTAISPWRAVLAIVRTSLLQVFRRKSYWIVLALALLNFMAFWTIIWVVTQVKDVPPEARQRMLEFLGFSPNPRPGRDNAYIMFMEGQSLVVALLLAFSGSLLVGSDFRENALAFYLSRRIERRHYIAGKLLAVAALVLLLTALPALLLFFEYGMFTSSLDYWRSQWRVPVAVLFYGAVLASVLSVLLVTLSAYLQRMAPIAITWASLFIMLRAARKLMHEPSIYWGLIDPWRDMHFVGRLAFDRFRNDDERRFGWCAAAVLAGVVAVCLAALVRRVRAVEVVE